MIVVYSPLDSPRLRFALDVVFTKVLRIGYTLVNDESVLSHGPVHITYATQAPTKSGLHITPTGLLDESGIRELKLVVKQGELPIIFPTGKGDMSFDIFSAVFYMVSRYEEYLPHKRDKHSRYSPEQSLAYKNGFLKRPVVDEWCIWLQDQLLHVFPELTFPKREFNHIVTIDVDTAFAYKGKGAVRTLGGFLKDLSSLNIGNFVERFKVVLGLNPDPYNVFEWVLELKKRYGFELIFFYLLGDYEVNDKNVSHRSTSFRSLIKHVNDYALSGLHPSYASSKDFSKIKIERNRLREITHMPVTKSRQHFLKFSLPQGYRALLHADITDDYSMAYASSPGFRSGTCTPHPFFDPDLNRITALTVHPFAFMEATFKYYEGVSPEHALNAMKEITDSVKRVNGTLYSTWHNDSLSNHGEWKDWQSVFTGLLSYVNGKS